MGILIYSNNVLENISSDDCERCMRVLMEIWISYVKYRKVKHQRDMRYVNNIVCCMLFLLRRRKYDHEFLREDSTILYEEIMSLCKHRLFASELSKAFFQFVENKGSLEGLASAVGGTIMGDDDN